MLVERLCQGNGPGQGIQHPCGNMRPMHPIACEATARAACQATSANCALNLGDPVVRFTGVGLCTGVDQNCQSGEWETLQYLCGDTHRNWMRDALDEEVG